jgi:hypothetical protein
MGSRKPQRYDGPERRRVDRSPPQALNVLGRARLRPGSARLYPELRHDDWYAVADRNPAALLALEAQPAARGYLWLFVQDGKGRHVRAEHFEVELGEAGSASGG